MDRDAAPDAGIEAERLRRRDVGGDQHFRTEPRSETGRLPGAPGESLEHRHPAIESEPGLGAPSERDKPGAEVVALGGRVLGDEASDDERLDEPVRRAHAEPRGSGEGGDPEVTAGRLEHAEQPEGTVDRLGAGALHEIRVRESPSHVADSTSVM